jgi:hypothetical protein
MDAARLFTVAAGEGATRVTPDIPIILRAPKMPDSLDPDMKFQFGECMALLWAAAALTEAPVLGRPGSDGLGGACSTSAVVTEQRCGLYAGRPEVFLKGVMDGPSDDAWWFQSPDTLAPFQAGASNAYPGPRRGRPLLRDEQYEFVLVFGQDAWSRSGVAAGEHDLLAASVAATERLNLDFALVVWALDEGMEHANLAKITPWPHFADIQFAWTPFVSRLAERFWP